MQWRAVLAGCCMLLGSCAVTAAEAETVRFVTQHFPPFSYLQQGQVEGPARALIDKACELLEQRCEHQLLPWERAQKRLQLGHAEGMYVIGWNPQRAEQYRFSIPLLSTEYGFFVRGDDPLHRIDVQALAGYQVAAMAASNTLTSLQGLQRQGHGFEIIEVNDSATAFRLLAAGRVHAVYSNREVGHALIRQHRYDELHYAVAHKQLDYFIGFNPDQVSDVWLARFNQHLQQLHTDGTARQLLRRYGIATKDRLSQ